MGRLRNCQAGSLGGIEVDLQFELGRLFDREIRGLDAAQ
jgi:hypothetical protein